MSDEPPKENLVPEGSATPENLSEVNKVLLHQLDAMIPRDNKEGFGRFVYMGKSENTPLFEFSMQRGLKKGVHSIEIHPHADSATDKMQRIFVTSKGEFPESFVDKNGVTRRAHIKYELDDTGKGQKIVHVYETLGQMLGVGRELPVSELDLKEGEDLYFPETLGQGDYRQLQSYLALFTTGQLKVT